MAACSSAEGMVDRPLPWRIWTWPPSWSVATSSGVPWVVSGPTRAVMASTTPRIASAPAWVWPAMKTLPTWWVDTASMEASRGPAVSTPTMMS